MARLVIDAHGHAWPGRSAKFTAVVALAATASDLYVIAALPTRLLARIIATRAGRGGHADSRAVGDRRNGVSRHAGAEGAAAPRPVSGRRLRHPRGPARSGGERPGRELRRPARRRLLRAERPGRAGRRRRTAGLVARRRRAGAGLRLD